MPLIVETSECLADSDTYVDLVEARAIAEKYGITLSDADLVLEQCLRKAYMYLLLFDRRMQGCKVQALQTGLFPRLNTSSASSGYLLGDVAIPSRVKLAQVYAAEEYCKGTDVRETNIYDGVSETDISGVIDIKFSSSAKTGTVVTITKALDCLRPYMTKSSGVIHG